jgi:hypothetical protein
MSSNNIYHSDIQIKKEIIKKAICHYVALIDSKYLPESIFNVLSKFINPNFIDDKSLLSNERIKDHIDWDKLDKLKLLRLIVRDKYVLERLDLNKHDFTLRDLIPVFIMHPDLIEYFDIDYDNLSAIDAIKLLEINVNFLVKIDLGKYTYSKNEIVKILESFYKYPEIIEKLNFETLDHYAIRTLIIKSGEKYVHKLDLKKLKALDWMEIAKTKPELIKYCDLKIFQTGDCFLLTKIVQILPHLDYLIEENRYNISALGWESLLIFDPEKYSKFCNYDSLSKKNWENITSYHPGMTNLMNRYIL